MCLPFGATVYIKCVFLLQEKKTERMFYYYIRSFFFFQGRIEFTSSFTDLDSKKHAFGKQKEKPLKYCFSCRVRNVHSVK